MGKQSRLKKARREAKAKAGVRGKLPRGERIGTLDDLTDDVERFLDRLHQKSRRAVTLAVINAKTSDELSPEAREMVSSGPSCGSCTAKVKGCCYLAVSAVLVEALPAARRVIDSGMDTPEFRERLHAVGDSMESMKQEEWFETMTPCVFLTEDQRCGIYSIRPSPCRSHIVFSPPENCEPIGPGAEPPRTLQVNHDNELNHVFRWNFEVCTSFFGFPDPKRTGKVYIGSFPKMVVRILDALDHKDYRAALRDQDWPDIHNPPPLATS